MKYKEYDNPEVIEPEILDENGRKLSTEREPVQETVKRELNPLRRTLMAVLGSVSALLSGFMMLCAFCGCFCFYGRTYAYLKPFRQKAERQSI